MKLVRIGRKVLFDLDSFVYAENLEGVLHKGTRIWLNPHGSSQGTQQLGSPPNGFKPYIDVDEKLWEIQKALEEVSNPKPEWMCEAKDQKEA